MKTAFPLAAVFLISLGLPALSKTSPMAMCVPQQKRAIDETCLVDGDTIWLDGIKHRLKGFDTPEPYQRKCGGAFETALAKKASTRLLQLLNSNHWTVESFGKERRGNRTLSTIKIKGQDVGDILIAERLARRWPDGNEFWCRN